MGEQLKEQCLYALCNAFHPLDLTALQDRTALGMKLEDEMELPRVKWEKYRHSAKAGIGKATVKFSGRKESAVGANAEYQVVAGEKENIQVI